jgi:Zn-dependent peptidase ImmA (M78 family)
VAKRVAKKVVGPKIPASIQISGHDFAIETSELEEMYGDCDVQQRKIRINSAKSLEKQWETLFHEVIHAILGISGHSELLKEDGEEALTRLLEHQLWPLVDFR